MPIPLVSIVIPAHNAENTLDETIGSVVRQSHENLDIIIVDDGSTDRTWEMALAWVRKDVRIRVISQKNSGVALARNTGIEAARGAYIAPLDADDLWHPKRVQMHVEALEAAGQDTAVAYSPFFLVDGEGKAYAKSVLYNYSGDVFETQLGQNLVGNGSGLTVRRSAAMEVGGYSSLLLERGAQGCEDFLFQLELALRYRYVCVPHYLVGYRKYPGNMSSNLVQMRYSQLHMYAYLRSKYQLPKEAVREHASEILWSLVRVVHAEKGKTAAGVELMRWVRNFYQMTHIMQCISEFFLMKLGKLLRRFPQLGPSVASRLMAGVNSFVAGLGINLVS
jgi:cellulose synthase/poly-beta-1,6-N-acetylglucosamine synthase-like glycosyltransferase